MAVDFLRQLWGSTGAGFGNALSGSPVAATSALATPGLMSGGAAMGAMTGSSGMTGRMGGPGTIGAEAGAMGAMASPAGGPFDGGLLSMGLGGGNLLTGSAFALNRETSHGGILSFWSRGRAVVVLRAGGGAGAQRRRAHDDVRGRLREGTDGDGAVAGSQPGPGRLRRGWPRARWRRR